MSRLLRRLGLLQSFTPDFTLPEHAEKWAADSTPSEEDARERLAGWLTEQVGPEMAQSHDWLGGAEPEVAGDGEALTERETQHGLVHPDTVQAVWNLACFHYNLGQHVEALPLFRRAEGGVAANPDNAICLNIARHFPGITTDCEKRAVAHTLAVDVWASVVEECTTQGRKGLVVPVF